MLCYAMLYYTIETLPWNTTNHANAKPSYSHFLSYLFRCRLPPVSLCRYGDVVPRSKFGRLFAVVWMMVGMAIYCTLIASITSSFEKVNTERDVFELTKKRVSPSGLQSLPLVTANWIYLACSRTVSTKHFSTFSLGWRCWWHSSVLWSCEAGSSCVR